MNHPMLSDTMLMTVPLLQPARSMHTFNTRASCDFFLLQSISTITPWCERCQRARSCSWPTGPCTSLWSVHNAHCIDCSCVQLWFYVVVFFVTYLLSSCFPICKLRWMTPVIESINLADVRSNRTTKCTRQGFFLFKISFIRFLN